MDGAQFEFTQKYSIAQAKLQKLFPIPEGEWNRLKRMVNEIIPASRLFQILWALLSGVFLAAIGVLATLKTAGGPIPSWYWTLAWSVTVASAVGAVICFIADSQQKESTSRTVSSVLEEMKTIENSYEDLQEPPAAVQEQEAR